ncbi:hypothetical protein CMO88_02895 [Candidatus Woesearchaeota archaeon]|nr:hypothetical protein [Candidatus Woesearchaeota archaeon]|tara:strand:+ start:5902 stop:6123 length:222 start_codon:yes stop_codon:yes gene_type:complete
MVKLGTKVMQIIYGEVVVSILTIIVSYAFFTNTTQSIIRNVVIVTLVFLAVYVLWIKMYGNYGKMYKARLTDE